MGHFVKRFATAMSVCFLLSKFLPSSCMRVTNCVLVKVFNQVLTAMCSNSLQQMQGSYFSSLVNTTGSV